MQALLWSSPFLLESQVEVDISLSAFANARMHFDTKKKHAIKQQKTVDATERVSGPEDCSVEFDILWRHQGSLVYVR